MMRELITVTALLIVIVIPAKAGRGSNGDTLKGVPASKAAIAAVAGMTMDGFDALLSLPRRRQPMLTESTWVAASAAMTDGVNVPNLTVARLQYDGGGDWYGNPSSLPNLLAAIATRTSLKVERTEARVRLTDDALFDHPFLHVTGHGNIRFTDAEVTRLRKYLEQGGFLHVDDNYGLDESFRREIRRVFPDRALVDVPLSHPVYSIVYPFPQGIPKIHEHDGKPARGFGIFIGERLAVYYSYESDLGNGWEDPATYNDPPNLHEAALRMGVNLFVYAITSRPQG